MSIPRDLFRCEESISEEPGPTGSVLSLLLADIRRIADQALIHFDEVRKSA